MTTRRSGAPRTISTPAYETVLGEIFSHEVGAGHLRNEPHLSPGFTEIKKLALLLARNAAEEELQQFLSSHPRFLMAYFGFADSSTHAFITKPRVGTSHVADFCVLASGQGGFGFSLVEIEPAHVPLFTRKGTPARRYQTALGQVQDWKQWMGPNFATFARETLALAKSFPTWPERKQNGSFQLGPPEAIDSAWNGFGGFDLPCVSYTIICGRWARLSRRERDRLVLINQQDRNFTKTSTWDQLVRSAFVRPYTSW